MPGQGTIVATGAIGYPPGLTAVTPEALKELGVQKVMTMTSTYDHRVIQGAESGAFLRRVDQLLQGEDGFYDGVLEALGLEAVVTGTDGPTPVTAAEPVPAATTPAAAPVADEALLQAVQAATSLVKAHRMHGHLAAARPARLRAGRRSGARSRHRAPDRRPDAAHPGLGAALAVPGDTFADALPRLREVYTGTIAYEIEHISEHEQRVWLRQAIECGAYRKPLSAEEQRLLLERLSAVEALETYLHKAFLGKKQFSIEGSTRSCRCSTRRSSWPRTRARARWCSAWRTAAASTCSRTTSAGRTSRSWWSSRASRRCRSTPPRPRAGPATSSTTTARPAPTGRAPGAA